MFQLTPSQEFFLDENGFVVVPNDEFNDLFDVYITIKQRNVATFITSDTLLHAAHLFFDYLLRIVEITALRPQIVSLTQSLLDASVADLRDTGSKKIEEAARSNLAFFSVGAALLDPGFTAPDEVSELVFQELELIEQRKDGIPPPRSHILGVREDYSQYTPRGHYTRNDEFRSYFLAAMWYSRMGFYLYPSESHTLAREDVLRLARQALLICRNLERCRAGTQPAIQVWRALFETTALFSGRAEDPGPDEYLDAARYVYGDLPSLEQLDDDVLLEDFMNRLRNLPRPRVLSTYYLSQSQRDSVTPDWQDGTFGFRFLPQRFVPDSHIFSEIVWDRVGRFLGEGQPFTLYNSMYEGAYRGVPRGLDVLAAFGSHLAEQILVEEGDAAYLGFAEKLSQLRALYANQISGDALYFQWLRTLLELLTPPEGASAFTHKQAWAYKQHHTALGSWAELRHDTVLYVKQSYTSSLRGMSISPFSVPTAYLEPYPGIYRGLHDMMLHIRERLEGWRLIDPPASNQLKDFEELLAELVDIAEAETKGQWPTGPQSERLADIGQLLRSLTTFPPDLMDQITSGTDSRMALVTDVHTHLEAGIVLEEAIGDPYLICVELELDGEPQRCWGGVYSYFEFKHSIDDRLTDEAWQAKTPKPAQPAWTQRFVISE